MPWVGRQTQAAPARGYVSCLFPTDCCVPRPPFFSVLDEKVPGMSYGWRRRRRHQLVFYGVNMSWVVPVKCRISWPMVCMLNLGKLGQIALSGVIRGACRTLRWSEDHDGCSFNVRHVSKSVGRRATFKRGINSKFMGYT